VHLGPRHSPSRGLTRAPGYPEPWYTPIPSIPGEHGHPNPFRDPCWAAGVGPGPGNLPEALTAPSGSLPTLRPPVLEWGDPPRERVVCTAAPKDEVLVQIPWPVTKEQPQGAACQLPLACCLGWARTVARSPVPPTWPETAENGTRTKKVGQRSTGPPDGPRLFARRLRHARYNQGRVCQGVLPPFVWDVADNVVT
jgi:hypothetical protein